EKVLDGAAAESKDTVPVRKELVMVHCNDIEDLIKYTHEVEVDETQYADLLFTYGGRYYYQIFFDYPLAYMEIERIEAKLLEYSTPAEIASMVIEEYGTIIMSNNVRNQVRKYFKVK